ncbi:Uncharacterized protein OS=Sorangium cellulosum (strain So ce56) GN=sce2304 PE=4 SV=1 [Gemmata massiliana]|uniref:Uncharacterized protein n=1 Tax=Gemmata massiliana TaxID=1210884 RepID=A0A6P2DLS1_9BACT|nr:hypothetical protein [Gemmata massiliana]VTS01789.1 Uncharacterized protein OS=Sorangium cellulosum (strain So ce56) GN=sce2304 PE=4 SV=1 [Gemmata massiliana]
MSLSPDELRELAKFVLLTRPDEIGCDDWLGYAPGYAELVASRQPVPEPLQKAAEHLDLCPECAEEFRALLEALKEDGVS